MGHNVVERTVVDLRDVRITGLKDPVTLARAQLLIDQKMISDGVGGSLPGMKSLSIRTSEELPMEMIFSAGQMLHFESGRYSGPCFVTDAHTLRVNPPVTGLER